MKTTILTLSFFLFSTISYTQVTNIEGNTYKTVKIGEQVWMAENLNTATFRNGDPIPLTPEPGDWEKAAEEGTPAWCYFDNETANGEIYGALYNWHAVRDSRELCPEGWHVPSHEEWTVLKDFLGEGSAIKMKTTEGWTDNGNGTNESGFSALPGSYRFEDAYFLNTGEDAHWWTSTAIGSSRAYSWNITHEDEEVMMYFDKPAKGYSVRCVKD